ncbi:MAG TPA: hypothetical protein VK971_03650 [Thiohalobacter sp.]|nr:hypothetical protein [Thiohalobacter sp.]
MQLTHRLRRLPVRALRRTGKRAYLIQFAGLRYRLEIARDGTVRILSAHAIH